MRASAARWTSSSGDRKRSACPVMLVKIAPGLVVSGCVLGKHSFQVTSIEHANLDIGMEFPQSPDFPIFSRNKCLTQCRYLEVEIVVRKVEVWCKCREETAIWSFVKNEGSRLILPSNAIEVEEVGYPPLRIVGELSHQWSRPGKPVDTVSHRFHASLQFRQSALSHRCSRHPGCRASLRIQLDDRGIQLVFETRQRQDIQDTLSFSKEVDYLSLVHDSYRPGSADD